MSVPSLHRESTDSLIETHLVNFNKQFLNITWCGVYIDCSENDRLSYDRNLMCRYSELLDGPRFYGRAMIILVVLRKKCNLFHFFKLMISVMTVARFLVQFEIVLVYE